MLIDTHRTVKRLTGAGANERLAEEITSAISQADDQVVTKDYLRAELRGVEVRITKRLYIVAGAVTSLLLAANFFA